MMENLKSKEQEFIYIIPNKEKAIIKINCFRSEDIKKYLLKDIENIENLMYSINGNDNSSEIFIKLKIYLKNKKRNIGKFEESINNQEFYGKYEEELESEELKKIAKDNDLSTKKLKSILYQNFKTNGSVYKTIFENLNDYKEIDSISYLGVKSLLTAHYRHTKTDYDLINKSGLNKEQIKSLRKSYN